MGLVSRFLTTFVVLSVLSGIQGTPAFADLTPEEAKKLLEQIYLKNPALRVQLNPTEFKARATPIVGAEAAKELTNMMLSDKGFPVFNSLRMELIDSLRGKPPGLQRVVVSGGSITGMYNAALLAQMGHQVTVYDTRHDQFSRQIQWSSRQSMADALASIDPDLAKKFQERVARRLDVGYWSIDTHGQRELHRTPDMETPDPRRVPQTGEAMLRGSSVATVRVEEFEKLLAEYIDNSMPNVERRWGTVELGKLDPKTGKYAVTEIRIEQTIDKIKKQIPIENPKGDVPLVIGAEGSGSALRKSTPAEFVPVTEARSQVAGIVYVEQGAEIATHYREEAPGLMVTGSMGHRGSNMRWVVADIDLSKIEPDPKVFGTDAMNPQYNNERQRLLEEEFRRIAAGNLGRPMKDVAVMDVSGAIRGRQVADFQLSQSISSTGHAGNNVFFIADSVGNGHWSAGGGAHVGMISHGERMKTLMGDLYGGIPEADAIQRYDRGVLSDTEAWGRKGMHYFYDSLSDADADEVYRTAVALWREGRVETPRRAVELMLPDGRKTKKIRPIRMPCKGILDFVLSMPSAVR